MSKISALIKLIEDPDEQIFSQVRNEILSMGQMIIPNLENALVTAPNADSVERISEILNEIQVKNLCENFECWKHSKEQDLLELMILVEQIRDFNFSKQNIIEIIAQIKMDIWLELNENQTILEQINIIDRIFYTKYEFTADEKESYALSNYFIYNLLKHKKGNDTTMGLLYLYLAQSQKISFWGVKLLSNFILAYTNALENKEIDDVLFYLNPYKILPNKNDKNAAKFSLPNLLDFFANAGVELNVADITPCSNTDIARRWLWFIHQAYIRKGDEGKMALLNKLLKLFVHI
ncbi:MAG: transglutaminase-like domain-containing protein [Bacteroidales bacterium]|jgi:regulator of sirC expression with transglutaminase-like and TPR domain|nr:transglutaminase-like domain-containing protein [Bacteroidales bacterium]